MSEPLRESLERELVALGDVPVHVNCGPNALAEARHVARFAVLRLGPTVVDGHPVPGLAAAGLAPEVSGELDELADEVERLNVATTTAPSVAIAAREMRAATRELTVPLRWLAVDDAAFDAELARLRRLHAPARTAGALAIALSETLHFVRAVPVREATVRGVAPTAIEDAEALLATWRDRELRGDGALRRRRAGLVVLINRRVRRVLVAADIAFRHHPAIAAEARTERRLRLIAEARRARRRGATPAVEPVTGPTA